MKNIKPASTAFDEHQSLQVIREMMDVSRQKFRKDGILFILWGWTMFLQYMIMYISRDMVFTYRLKRVFDNLPAFLILSALILTTIYILRQRRKVVTFIGLSLRFIWVSVFGCMVLVNLILFNVLHSFHPELQHPVFMVIVAFAIVVTGALLQFRLLIGGGIIFGLLALTSSYFDLNFQLILEAMAWLIAFIIPGHIIYSSRKKHP